MVDTTRNLSVATGAMAFGSLQPTRLLSRGARPRRARHTNIDYPLRSPTFTSGLLIIGAKLPMFILPPSLTAVCSSTCRGLSKFRTDHSISIPI